MKKEIKLELINGCFTVQEAKELLLNLYNQKIRFHELNNFSSQERFGKPDEKSLKRIQVLRENLKKLEDYMHTVENESTKLLINGSLHIRT